MKLYELLDAQPSPELDAWDAAFEEWLASMPERSQSTRRRFALYAWRSLIG